MNYTRAALAAGILLSTLPAMADDTSNASQWYSLLDSIKQGTNMSSFRLRYEYDDLNGSPAADKYAEGLTLRSLVGWQTASFDNFSFAAQMIDVGKLQDNFNDSTTGLQAITAGSNQPGKLAYAKIIDPDYTGVNQLYLDWTGLQGTLVRLGRQQVNLDNVRFIGDIGFRQVMQVFDGVSALNQSLPDTDAYLAHYGSVRQVDTVLRTGGHLDIAHVKYHLSPTESLVGYGYFSTFDDLGFGQAWFGAAAANAQANQSNKILGLRLDGAHSLDAGWKALYTAEYAKQNGFQGGDSRIDANYYKIGGGASYDNLSLRLDQEKLSSNHGLYAFQTPFGTNHLFQGWTDKFLATPAEGLIDSFITGTCKYADFSFFADYHLYQSDMRFNEVGGGTGGRYGTEWNAAVSYAYDKHISTKVEYGKFSEGDHYNTSANSPVQTNRIRDTEKLWLTAMYTF
ncbi:hypothetical protein GALL_347390 [mine drainage metagenome]|uniref:Alginate export domain-containing protein n=1 Tax=mine drainage metagenome TaxID=410659 RepID=A0A1J5QJJ4_9ZZZZ